jgi:hypothetical protein
MSKKRNISKNSITKTSASTAGVRRLIPEPLITALSLGLLTIVIGIVTGIHYDEAWVILRCTEIANGLRPLDGMTPYAGAIHQYILWRFFLSSVIGSKCCALFRQFLMRAALSSSWCLSGSITLA